MNWIILIVLLLFDLFFAVSRAALLNVRLPQLIDMVAEDQVKLEKSMNILEKPRLRTTLRLVVVLFHALVLACVWVIITSSGKEISTPGTFGIYCLVMVLLLTLEFLAERFPLRNPEAWAVRLAPIVRIIDLAFSPISSVLILLQGTDAQVQRNLGSVTEDELKTWVEVGQPEGGLEEDERKMIFSIFQFGDTLCREIMVPRIAVDALDVNTSLPEAIDTFVRSGHSRLPVFEDMIDNVVGLLYAKDLLKVRVQPDENPLIAKYLRQAYFVPESKKVDELLAEMQAKGIHIAIVVDEYGGMAGLVTLEDIVEEIVGEIRDEYDQSEERLVQELSPDEYLFLGRVSLDDFNDALSTDLETDQTDTLGGYFYGQMGRVPVEGDQLQQGDWKLTVEEVRGRRVGRIRALRVKDEESVEETDAD